jgi:uncharacterized Ntn-hydrolase superfamily protein
VGPLAACVAAAALLALAPAWATWSVVAVDQGTGQVAIGSATCFPQRDFEGTPIEDLRDIQAIVVPGEGVAAAQAGADATFANQHLIFEEVKSGTRPRRIIELLMTDPDIEHRQFGIVDLHGRSAGYTGRRNPAAALDRQGHVDGTGLYYSVQGNTLRSEAGVASAVQAFERSGGTLTDRVMEALEAGDAAGGDSRCTCETEPRPDAPCTRKAAHVAYILLADPGDSTGGSFNDGDYAMYIGVTEADIRPTEDANPVVTLRMRYDRWKVRSADK